MSTTTAPDGALRLETVSATVPGTPTRSPARQALGELTPNTRRALPGAGVGFEKKLLAAATSPVKPTLLRGAGAENALGLVIPHAGRKRAFHEVDGVFAGERDATRVRVEAEVAGGVAAGTATSAAPLGDSTVSVPRLLISWDAADDEVLVGSRWRTTSTRRSSRRLRRTLRYLGLWTTNTTPRLERKRAGNSTRAETLLGCLRPMMMRPNKRRSRRL